jgi:hypothetical protein
MGKYEGNLEHWGDCPVLDPRPCCEEELSMNCKTYFQDFLYKTEGVIEESAIYKLAMFDVAEFATQHVVDSCALS